MWIVLIKFNIKNKFNGLHNMKTFFAAIPFTLAAINMGMDNAYATTWNINNQADLNNAIVSSNNGDTWLFGQGMALTTANEPLQSVAINGGGYTLTGNPFGGDSTFSFNSIDLIKVENIVAKNHGGPHSHMAGGVISVYDANIGDGIHNGYFESNTAYYFGGAISVVGSSSNPNYGNLNGGIHNSHFVKNSVTGLSYMANGGAVNVAGEITGGIHDSSFVENKASNTGGALEVSYLMDGIHSSQFIDNVAEGNAGGAIYMGHLDGGIHSSTFTGNKATGPFAVGGAITFGMSVFPFNDAISGGIHNSTFSNNESTMQAGAIFVRNKNFTGGIQDSTFSNNHTGGEGGAIYIQTGNFSGEIGGSTFENNIAGNQGGAFWLGGNMDVSVASGKTTIFTGNKAAGVPSSIYFDGGLGKNANLDVEGSLFFYDPISATNPMNLSKNGSGIVVMGGNNYFAGGGDWNINSGILNLTWDSEGNHAQINGLDNFNLNAAGRLTVVPDISIGNITPAQINASNIKLDGTVTLGSDYRYHAQYQFPDTLQTALTLSTPYTGNGQVVDTNGTFTLGQFDYQYDSLRWLDPQTLVFNIRKSLPNPEVTGIYAANASYRTRLYNRTPIAVFNHIDNKFSDLEPRRELWGTALYSYIHDDGVENQRNSRTEIPTLIVGGDLISTDNSFAGVSASLSMPEYKQAHLKTSGKDYRAGVYGGHQFDNKVELGLQGWIGRGDIKHNRSIGNESVSADYNIGTWGVGVSLARDFALNDKTSIKPFVNYDYLSIDSDSYTEKGDPQLTIHATEHKEKVSRVRVGGQYRIQTGTADKNTGELKASLYYQNLAGDTAPEFHSSMNSQQNSVVKVRGGSVDRDAIGWSIGWNKELKKNLKVDLMYEGVAGRRSLTSEAKVNLAYEF